MSNITQFPIPALPVSQIAPLASATLNDILVINQTGLTGTETLAQILALYLPNLFLSFAGNPNGNVAGTTPQICYDTTNNILYVCTVTGTTMSAVWRTSIPIIQTNIITSGSANMVTNNRYVCNSSGTTALVLPISSNVGDQLFINGYTIGWSITQGSGQQILVSPNSSTLGSGGSVSSTHATDSLSLTCLVANTIWTANSFTGTGLTIV